MFIAQATGVLTSTLFVKAKRSLESAFMILFLLIAVIPFLGMNLRNLGYPTLADLIVLFNPLFFLQSQGNFWMALVASHALGWIFLAVAMWRIPSCWQETNKSSGLNWRERMQQFNYGHGVARKKMRERFFARNPFFWLVSRRRFGPLEIWCVLGAIGILYVLVFSVCKHAQIFIPTNILVFIFILTHILFLGLYARSASENLEQYRRDGSLEFLLCSTPITVTEIIKGQWLGVLRLYFWPLIVLFLSDLVQVIVFGSLKGGQKTMVIFFFVMVFFALNLIPIGWQAIWHGIRSEKPGNVFATTFREVFVFPFLISIVLSTCLLNTFPLVSTLPFVWVIINVTWNFILVHFTSSNIERNLRAYAVPGLEEEPSGFWKDAGRLLGRKWGRFRKSI